MIKLLASMMLATVLAVSAQAKETAAKGKPPLHANLARDTKGKEATAFTSADTNVYIVYHGDALKKGDKIRAVWYIEDGGKAIDKNAKVSESTNVANRDNAEGYLNIAKPAAGWPTGKWRVDLFVNDASAGSYKFTVSK